MGPQISWRAWKESEGHFGHLSILEYIHDERSPFIDIERLIEVMLC